MKQIEKISENSNYCAVNLNELNGIRDYSLIHPISKKEIEGKVFLKNITGATGTEISFNSLQAHTEQPYFHLHRKNEETYIILKGYGSFQVDDDCFGIKEGSVIRVAPKGVRGIYNASNEEMIYIVIQSKQNSLEEYTTDDGEKVPYQAKWK
ncbi:cupin domain-containing protein [Microbacter margulisiae]|uniref:Mannose-6-phosphate isomerase-like protein (Cupin superfamily) n=1 Tax=Microbacter margulisiae TaxID=1350067 RepID=A0A7W5DS04_9PORP|nr:cupin domain-containing protein [Microbacter margulisiae]MBB3187658.1 mannose-6-phosphate isomerase-like protein (cupin superfamily) [Microbacter margulisiae]